MAATKRPCQLRSRSVAEQQSRVGNAEFIVARSRAMYPRQGSLGESSSDPSVKFRPHDGPGCASSRDRASPEPPYHSGRYGCHLEAGAASPAGVGHYCVMGKTLGQCFALSYQGPGIAKNSWAVADTSWRTSLTSSMWLGPPPFRNPAVVPSWHAAERRRCLEIGLDSRFRVAKKGVSVAPRGISLPSAWN